MNYKIYTTVSGIIFTIVATVHLLRVILKWDLIIGTWIVPMWVSVLAVLITGCLAITSCRLCCKARKKEIES